MTESLEVEILARGTVALKKDGATLTSVAEALVEPVAKVESKVLPTPKVVEFTPELRGALAALPHIFGAVQPTEVRELTEAEMAAVLQEQEELATIEKPLALRKEAINAAIRNHMHLRAVREGLVSPETPLDKNGYAIVAAPKEPQRVNVPGSNKAWALQYVKGALGMNTDLLKELLDSGEISREVYLSFTEEKRVFSPSKAFRALVKNPTLLWIIRRMSSRGPASTSLFVRPQK